MLALQTRPLYSPAFDFVLVFCSVYHSYLKRSANIEFNSRVAAFKV